MIKAFLKLRREEGKITKWRKYGQKSGDLVQGSKNIELN